MTAAASGGDGAPFGRGDAAQPPVAGAPPERPGADRAAGTDTPPIPPRPAAPPPMPAEPPVVPAAPVPSTGWTGVMPAVLPGTQPPAQPASPSVPSPVTAQPGVPTLLRGMSGGLRGRILVVEGGYGGSGRRPWARGGSSGQTPVLSAMLAAVSPQILLAADAVDAVHLPGAVDPQSVLAHLRAASRHPGPLLVHIGGHLVTDRKAEQLYLTLRDSKAADSLPWQAVAAELSHRPAEWDTLVIADLSADQAAWPLVTSAITPLVDGIPLWAAVHPDPERIGTFTRALIEALHGGRSGAEAVLAPEQLRQQVHSVLRPDAVTITAHAPNRPIFRNTARQIGGGPAEPRPYEGPRPAAVKPKPVRKPAKPAVSTAPEPAAPEPAAVAVVVPREDGKVSLVKAGVPPTPRPPVRPWSLVKTRPVVTETDAASTGETRAGAESVRVELRKANVPSAAPAPRAVVSLAKSEPPKADAPKVETPKAETPNADAPAAVAPEAATTGGKVTLAKAAPAPVPGAEQAEERTAQASAGHSADPMADYREAIVSIVRSADAGDHEKADELSRALEEQATTAHGPVDPVVLQVRQVRAHVSRLAGRSALAAEIYREVALTLLRTEGPEHPETQQAATNAEACWRSIADPAEAIKVAPDIIELRAHLPGPGNRKLRSAERYLKQLAAAKAAAGA